MLAQLLRLQLRVAFPSVKANAYRTSTEGQKEYRVRRVGESAFTLPEAMVSVGLTAVLFVSLYAGISGCFRVVQSNREHVRATQILQEKMEVARLYTWSQLTGGQVPATFTASYANGSAPGVTYTGKVTITHIPNTESYSSEMRRIRVRLTWDSGGVSHSREMTTLISKYGLQNYLY
jgi:hypothetical protein